MITIPDNNLGSYFIPNECNNLTCVDVGANIGDFTLQNKDKFKKIHFYEPYKPCYDIIQSKIINLDHITGFNEAVYKEDNQKLQMVSHFNKEAGSNALQTEILNDHWDSTLGEVTTVSLLTILTRIGGHINYLKCDCETSEYFLLLNQDLSQIDYIGIELHWQMGEERYNELINFILKTHSTDVDISFSYDTNKEALFKNNLL